MYKTRIDTLFGDHPLSIKSAIDKTEYFIIKSAKKYGNKYDYSKSIYKSSNTKIIITCPENHHGDFEVRAGCHLNKYAGCQKCGFEKVGYNKTIFKNNCNNGLGILYVIKCFNETEEFYKIGITSRSIEERFKYNSDLPYKYEVIQEIRDTSENIYTLEKVLHKIYCQWRYKPLKPFGGITECFMLPNQNTT